MIDSVAFKRAFPDKKDFRFHLYNQFKNSNRYADYFKKAELEYIIYLDDESLIELKPVGRGIGMNTSNIVTANNHIITGVFESFVITNNMPSNLRWFLDKTYVIDMVCSHDVTAKLIKDYIYDKNGLQKTLSESSIINLSGLVLKRWRDVEFNGEGIARDNIAETIYGDNAVFVAKREFSGEEVCEKIDLL